MHRTAYIFLILTMLFWGGNAVAGKFAVGHVSPLLLTTLRWVFAFALLVAIGHRHLVADWALVRRHLVLLATLGFFGFTCFNVTLYTALTHTSAINVTIEQAGIPMLVFLLNFLFFRTRVSAGQFAGFVLTVSGVALAVSHGDLSTLLRLQLNFGDALMVIAILVYAGYTVALPLRPAIHWQSFMIVLAGAALLTSLPFAAAELAAGGMIWPDSVGWATVLYIALFPSLLAQVLYVRGVEMIGPNRAGLFINLVPIFGTLLSILVLGEVLQAYHAIALALALGGIWIAELSGRHVARR